MGSKSGYNKCQGPVTCLCVDNNIPDKLNSFLIKWTEEAKKQSNYTPQWYVKYAGIVFQYEGKWYALGPEHLGGISQELFEHLSREMENELVEMDAEDVFYTGMLD